MACSAHPKGRHTRTFYTIHHGPLQMASLTMQNSISPSTEVPLLYNFYLPKTNRTSQPTSRPTKINVKRISVLLCGTLSWTKELFNSKIDEQKREHFGLHRSVIVYTLPFANEMTAEKSVLECNVNKFSF